MKYKKWSSIFLYIILDFFLNADVALLLKSYSCYTSWYIKRCVEVLLFYSIFSGVNSHKFWHWRRCCCVLRYFLYLCVNFTLTFNMSLKTNMFLRRKKSSLNFPIFFHLLNSIVTFLFAISSYSSQTK